MVYVMVYVYRCFNFVKSKNIYTRVQLSEKTIARRAENF